MMNSKEVILWVKCACYLIVGVFTPWSAALAQWANSGEVPGKAIWIGIILPASMIGGANSLLSFLSSSFGKYQADKEREGTEFLPKPKV